MFQKNESRMGHNKSGLETTIAQGVRVEGDFQSEGPVSIDGELHGSLSTNDVLHVGQSAVIQANVFARSAVVAGTIIGNIKSVESLELQSTSKIEGDVITAKISVSPGAFLNGRISMGETETRKTKEKRSQIQSEEE